MARRFASLLALAVIIALCTAEQRCRHDKDCSGFNYCQAPICVPARQAGDSCNRDDQCLSRDCKSNGRCKSVTRRLVVGGIIGIAVSAVVLALIVCIIVYCCCIRKFRRRSNNDNNNNNDGQA